MSEQLIEKREEVKALLRKLFRSENADLDFGIYRIMNFKRKEIEQFIEHDLIESAETEFREYSKVGTADIDRELERLRSEINRDFGSGTIDSEGRVIRNHDAPKIKDYLRVQEEYERAALTQEQVNDVFNHVYEFFSRYYEDGDFIPKPRYGGREKYFIPYNGEEVVLHWANQEQYYVKTGEFFKKYSFKVGRFRVNFTLVEASLEANSVKGENKFFVLAEDDPVRLDEAAGEAEISFNYRELTDVEKGRLGTRNIQATLVLESLEIIRPLLDGSSISGILLRRGDEKPLMERHLNAYVDRNTKDYFIHKNLKGFFERELDFYLKNEVWNLDELEGFDERNTCLIAAKAKAIRGISQKIIEFLSQIEEYQRRLWEKKKFVVKTGYVVTLDLIPQVFYEEILDNNEQLKEWKELGFGELNKENVNGQKVSVDTKHFPENFKERLLEKLSQTHSLDDLIDGVLIKSDNFHALSLLQSGWSERVNCVYLDPPFNTAGSEILYKNNYKHSSWICLLWDRIQSVINFMRDDSIICVAIDDAELRVLSYCLSTIFGEKRELAAVVVRSNPHGRAMASGFSRNHEYALFFGKTDQAIIGRLPRSEERQARYPKSDERGIYSWINFRGTGAHTTRIDRPKLFYPIYVSKEGRIRIPSMSWSQNTRQWKPLEPPKSDESVVLPIDEKKSERVWILGWERAREEVRSQSSDWDAKLVDGKWQVYKKYRPNQEGAVPGTWWEDAKYSATESGTKILKDLFGERESFSYPKSVYLVEDCLRASNCSPGSWVLDFLAGSGTTAHSVINLNREDNGKRKYILVEMADYFDTVILPRIKKVVFNEKWKDGKPILGSNSKPVSHMIKYQYLEQYEDTLNNIWFRSREGAIQRTLDGFPDYFISYMLDYETSGSPTRLSVEQFKTPFNYKIKTLSSGEEKEETVDLVETFNYLIGLYVNGIRTYRDGDRIYRAVHGQRDHEQVAVIWRDTHGLDLERDKKIIEETILTGSSPDIIYVNGDSCVKNARSIEPEFRRRMYAEDSYA